MDLEEARDGVLKNANPELCRIAARYRVNPRDLELATAELMNTAGESIRLSFRQLFKASMRSILNITDPIYFHSVYHRWGYVFVH